jgi:hypothetical protein
MRCEEHDDAEHSGTIGRVMAGGSVLRQIGDEIVPRILSYSVIKTEPRSTANAVLIAAHNTRGERARIVVRRR